MNALKTKLNQIEDIEKQLRKLETEAREIQRDYVNAISEVCCCSRNFEYNRKSKLLTIKAEGDKTDFHFWCFESQALGIYIQVPILKVISNGAFGFDSEMIINVQRAINDVDNKYISSPSERECDVVSEVRGFESAVKGFENFKKEKDDANKEVPKKRKTSFDVRVVPFSERAEKKREDYSKSIKKDISKQPDVISIATINESTTSQDCMRDNALNSESDK